MSQNIFEQYDIFKTMEPGKIEIMRELVENMQGKSMREAAPSLLNATTKLKQKNLSFSQPERELLMEILSSNMSAEEKAKLEMLKKTMAKKR